MRASLRTLHLHKPFHIAHGASSARVVLRVEREGRVAEAPFVPYYGEDPERTLALLQRDDREDELPRTAQLALNLLDLDLRTFRAGVPLSQLASDILGPSSMTPPGCRSLGIPEDLDTFADEVSALSKQFTVLKLKLGSGDLEKDLNIVEVARRIAPEQALLIDVNGGWAPEDAPLMIQQLSVFQPALIEQPIHHRHSIETWETLRAALPEHAPPIYADESAQSADDVPRLAPFVDGVNVKLLKAGGFERAIAMISAAREYRLKVLLGCMIESSLGTTAAAHLAPWADWIDLDGHFYLSDDDYRGIVYDERGNLIMPDRPGIGALAR